MRGHAYYDHVMFRLSAVGARAELRLRELLAPLGLIPQSYAVLHHIAAADGVSQQEEGLAWDRPCRGFQEGRADSAAPERAERAAAPS